MGQLYEEKEKLKNKIENCLNFIEKAEKEFESDFPLYKEKLNAALKALDSDRLKIGLFGSFSDGKSTILAAITGNLGIEIAPEPTRDRVKFYKFRDLEIVDTPGLFSENIPHDEETKKFISEADLIIFTTEAINPLKESQHEVIRWILKDLGKISQTVFVINKMDTVADVYSEEDFNRVCQTKKETVINTLNQILGEDRQDYTVICLSADPFGLGLKEWFKNKEEYLKISRIGQLEEIILNIAKEKAKELKKITIEAILKDVSIRGSNEFSKKMEELEKEVEKLKNEYDELQSQLKFINQEIYKATNRIKDRLDSFRVELISSFQVCTDFDCLKNTIDLKLGKEGKPLQRKIEQILSEELEPVYNYIEETIQTLEKITKNLEQIELLNLQLLKLGSGIVSKAGSILKSTRVSTLRNTILKTRDFLKLPIKFKPWQAVKFAKALQILGAILEIVTTISKIGADLYLNHKKSEIIEKLNKFFDEFIENVDTKFIKENYFPTLLELEKVAKELSEELDKQKELLSNYKKARIIFEKCRGVLV